MINCQRSIMTLPPNIKLMQNKSGVYSNGIYQFTDPELASIYFTVSVSYNFNSTAVICCDDKKRHRFDLPASDIEILKKKCPYLSELDDGRVFLLTGDYTDGERILWELSGEQYAKYALLVSEGTYDLEKLDKLGQLINSPESTKEEIKALYDELYSDELKIYHEFLKLQ